MNRIAGNLDWLTTNARAKQLYSGPSVTKKTYVYNDYVTVAEWQNLFEVLDALTTAFNVEAVTASDAMTWDNMNTIESQTLVIYERYQLLMRQSANNHYAGDSIYAMNDAGSIYSAGRAL